LLNDEFEGNESDHFGILHGQKTEDNVQKFEENFTIGCSGKVEK
jgi:hypothetical protein